MKLTGLIKVSLLAGGILYLHMAQAQELYVFTEPASNMPSRSISGRISAKYVTGDYDSRTLQRYTPEVMFGLSKKWMVHFAPTFSDMYSSNLRWESARLYAKYRFLSNDEVHKHFRMAAFAEGSKSRNTSMYQELGIEGDQTGVQGGLIATQLVNKLAVSATMSYLQVKRQTAIDITSRVPNKAITYSLSAGYLVLPLEYTSFKQTNFNVYMELLGQRSLEMKAYEVDLAPAIQLIFNSNAKLNIGYRFQVAGDIMRMGDRSWLISFERTFLSAW